MRSKQPGSRFNSWSRWALRATRRSPLWSGRTTRQRSEVDTNFLIDADAGPAASEAKKKEAEAAKRKAANFAKLEAASKAEVEAKKEKEREEKRRLDQNRKIREMQKEEKRVRELLVRSKRRRKENLRRSETNNYQIDVTRTNIEIRLNCRTTNFLSLCESNGTITYGLKTNGIC